MALVLHVICFGITMGGNVPLNDALTDVDLHGGAAVIEAGRAAFEDAWNRLHLLRTIAVVAAFGCSVAVVLRS